MNYNLLHVVFGGYLASWAQMSTGVLEQTLPNECFAQQQLDVLVCPLLCGQSLEKHHNPLPVISVHPSLPMTRKLCSHLEVHLHQLVRPFYKECCTDVYMESREALLLSLV